MAALPGDVLAVVVLVVSVAHLLALLLVGSSALLLIDGLIDGLVSLLALFFGKTKLKYYLHIFQLRVLHVLTM